MTLRQRTRQLRALLLAFMLSIAGIPLAVLVTSEPALAVGETVVMGIPFDGRWAYNTPTTATCGTTAHPSCHELYGYHWSVDYYAAAGTEVKLKGTSTQGTVSFQTSGLLGGQECGQGLSISVYVNSTQVGALYITHLDDAVASSNIANGGVVGKVRYHCKNVDHVHFGYKNTAGNYACYKNYSNATHTAGMLLNYGDAVGVLGSSNGGVQQACATIPSTGTAAKPAVVSRSSDKMDVFYRDSSNNLVNRGWNSVTGWSSGNTWADDLGGNPAAVARGTDGMDVFFRKNNGSLWNRGWNATAGWNGGSQLAANCVEGDPTVVSRSTISMDVFWRSCNNELKSLAWTSSGGWGGITTRMPNGVVGNPVVIARTPNNLDVFYRNGSNDLVNVFWDVNTGWGSQSWQSNMVSDPSPTARASGTMDVFYRKNNNYLSKRSWGSGGWTYEDWQSDMDTSPAAVARDSGHLNVFYRKNNGYLSNRWWDWNVGWGYEDWGDSPSGAPAVISRSLDKMDVFFRGSDGQLVNRGWDASTGWHFTPLGGSMA